MTLNVKSFFERSQDPVRDINEYLIELEKNLRMVKAENAAVDIEVNRIKRNICEIEADIAKYSRYIEKSKNKTARLFGAGLCGVYLYNNESPQNLEQVKEFALNFGIAFQIHNDLKNINNTQKLCEDIENGDYSIPVIYYLQENPENKKPDINKKGRSSRRSLM